MKAVPIENATRRLGAPQDWDHEKNGICHTLEIIDLDGWMVSAWRPSDSELALLKEGKPIFLWIQGTRHPVISLTVG